MHITALANDYYHYDPVGHRLSGERTGKVIRLGDTMRIRVAKVNLDERKIDFVPEALQPHAAHEPSRRGRKKPLNKAAGKPAQKTAQEKPQATGKRRRRRSKSKSADA